MYSRQGQARPALVIVQIMLNTTAKLPAVRANRKVPPGAVPHFSTGTQIHPLAVACRLGMAMQLPNGRLGLSLRLGLLGSDEMEAAVGPVGGAEAGGSGRS